MHSAAVLRGGALLMWGDNSHGKCGVAFGDSPADPNPSPDPSPSAQPGMLALILTVTLTGHPHRPVAARPRIARLSLGHTTEWHY